MSTAAIDLRELHQLHLGMEEIQEKLKSGPRKVKAREQLILKKETDRSTQKDKLTELKKGIDQKTLQLKTNESKIIELRVKLNAASSNREFDIFKGQIEADTMANSVLEDEILEYMDKVDQAQQDLDKEDEDLAAAQTGKDRVAAEITAAESGLRDEISKLESSIAEVERSLSANVIEMYRRLIQAHGANALAQVDDGVCTSCYVSLLPQSRVELNSGVTVFCKNCGRLLYLPKSD